MRGYKLNSLGKSVLFALCCVLGTALAASAQDFAVAIPADVDPGVEVRRDARELQAEVRPRPVDRDVADTALVFTNLGREDHRVFCVGFDDEGRRVGRAWLKLPARGLRYLLASDLSRGKDFIGHAQCSGGRNVTGSLVFLGPDLTDLPVLQPELGDAGRIRFPLVATY